MIQKFLFPFSRPKIHEGPRYGDMYERGLAACIDLTLIYLLLNSWLFEPVTRKIYAYANQDLIKALPANIPLGEFVQKLWEAHMIQLWALNSVFQIAVVGFFMVGSQITYQTTPGKWLFGLKVMRHGSDEPVGPVRYIVRFIAYFLACAPLMIGMLWSLFNKQRRGWHDYIAGTVVINTRPHGWYYAKFKQGFRWLRTKLFPARTVQDTMAEPTPEKRHEDGDKPV